MKNNSVDIGFIGVAQFQFTIPDNLSLEAFRGRHEQDNIHVDPMVLDENFYPSTILRKSASRVAVIVRLTRDSTLDRCRAFVKSQGGQLPNAQGGVMALEKGIEHFPLECWVFALDRAENLHRSNAIGEDNLYACALIVNRQY